KELFEKYRNKVFEAFYPKYGYNYKLKDGKQAVSDFQKLGTSTDFLTDLMLFYVETGVKFTNAYGDVNESFYKSLATTFADSLAVMRKENLLDKFEDRGGKIVGDTSGIGWGFHDYLVQAWIDFYPTEDEEDFEEEENQTEQKGKIIKLDRQ